MKNSIKHRKRLKEMCLISFLIILTFQSLTANAIKFSALNISTHSSSVNAGQEIKLQITIQSLENFENIQVELDTQNRWFLIANNNQEIGSMNSGQTRIIEFNIETSKYTPPGNYQLNYTVYVQNENTTDSTINYVQISVKEQQTSSITQSAGVILDPKVIFGLILGALTTFFFSILYNRTEKWLTKSDKRKQLKLKFNEDVTEFKKSLTRIKNQKNEIADAQRTLQEITNVLTEIENSPFDDLKEKAKILLHGKQLQKLQSYFESTDNIYWNTFLRDHYEGNIKLNDESEDHKTLRFVENKIEELQNQINKKNLTIQKS